MPGPRVRLWGIETPGEAEAAAFLGSPTVRVDGVDVEPGAGKAARIRPQVPRLPVGRHPVGDSTGQIDPHGPRMRRPRLKIAAISSAAAGRDEVGRRGGEHDRGDDK